MDLIKFKQFLDDNLKFGQDGFKKGRYQFGAFLKEARNNMAIGNYSYELSKNETKSGVPECFYFESNKE